MRVLELHAPLRVVSRAQGRSAVAAAAYRSGTRLVDERTGEIHDYRNRGGVEETAILLPADAPEWAEDREKLWSSCELREKHPRGRPARDLVVALPREFDARQRREAGLRIAQWFVDRHGLAVDVAWHEPSRRSRRSDNHHVHLLMTTRRFEKGDWARAKDRAFDDLKSGPEQVRSMRQAVAEVLNNICTRDRLEVEVEHLSFADRGLDREPTQHMGPIASNYERAGKATEIGDHNRAVRARNAERSAAERERAAVDGALGRGIASARGETGSEESVLGQPREEALQLFYAATRARRAAMLEALDRAHGSNQQELKVRAARLQQTIDSAGLFTRCWKFVTGKDKQEQREAERVRNGLAQIDSERQAAFQAFERDRQQRLRSLIKQFEESEKEMFGLLDGHRSTLSKAATRGIGDRMIGSIEGPRPTAQRQSEVDREL